MEIYQNINSKGSILELHELIKNYILLSCDEKTLNDNDHEIIIAYNSVLGNASKLNDFFTSLILFFKGNIVSNNKNDNLKKF